MNTLLSADQQALQESCHALLQKEWPPARAIETLGPGGSAHSRELWMKLAEAGWLGFPFSSEIGGGEADLTDLGVIYRAAGQRLVPTSFYSCLFAGMLVDALATSTQKKDLLGPMIAGNLILTTAYAEPQAAETTRLFTAAATAHGHEWILSGVKSLVADLGSADVVLILARLRLASEAGGWGLFAVRKDVLKERLRRMPAFGSTSLWEIKLDQLKLPMECLLGGLAVADNTLVAFEKTVEKATALMCMEMAGGIQGVLDFTVAYVKERKQFGRPLGANQAVQHMLANMVIALDGARIAALKALFLVAKGRAAGRSLAIAKVCLGETYVNATITSQQLCGAMGYSRETGLYLWSERAKVTDVWFGTRASHLQALTRHMGLVARIGVANEL